MKSRLSSIENEVLVAVLKRLPVEPSAKTFSFRFAGAPRDTMVASSTVAGQPGLRLVFTLGSGQRQVFMTVTDGDEGQVADVLARVEDYSSHTDVKLGDTLVMESQYLSENGRAALLLLEPKVSNVLREFPDHLTTRGGALACFLTVFLSEAEYSTKKRSGIGALIERMQSDKKDLVSIRATPPT
jgi:hypothetical protein